MMKLQLILTETVREVMNALLLKTANKYDGDNNPITEPESRPSIQKYIPLINPLTPRVDDGVLHF